MDNLSHTPEEHTEEVTSGEHLTHWLSSAEPLAYEALNNDMETDVLIVGGGISGLTTAYRVAASGKKVVLVEDGMIGSGESGRTTGHISNALDDRYYRLEKLFGEEGSRFAASSHTLAIDWIETLIDEEGIDCDFKRVDGYLFVHATDKSSSLQREFEATRRAGLKTDWLHTVPDIAGEHSKCIHFPDQAQFHIIKYLCGLAKAVTEKGGLIYTRSKAEDINSSGATVNGYTVKAKHIVVATNTPVNNLFAIHTKQYPYRTYVIAAAVPKDAVPFNLWWDTGDMKSRWISEPYHYARVVAYNDEYDLLIVGGEDHRTGQADTEEIPEENRYKKLIEWAAVRFPEMKHVVYRWSGQIMEPVDALGYAGKNPGCDNIYIITGDSGNGLTHGTLGGLLVCDLITGEENPYVSLYDPSRIPIKALQEYISQGVNVIAQYGDWLSAGDVDEAKDLMPGTGGIISNGLKKIAMYRDDDGQLHAFSAVCPHLGCIVHWNADERSFDCPCHGSRFTKAGEVMNGPASDHLKKLEIRDK